MPPLYLYEIEWNSKSLYRPQIKRPVLEKRLQSRKVEDSWLKQHKTLVLEVPSALVSVEKNYLLNPDHSGFKKIKLKKHGLFSLDKRLLESCR